MSTTHKTLLLLLATMLLISCGSSRRATSQRSTVPLLPNANRTTTQLNLPPQEIPVVEEISIFVQRMDSLLLASDTLLSQTQLGLHIVDLTTGEILYAKGEFQRMRPASSEKMVTAIAALDMLGPSYTLNTQLLTAGTISGNTLQGDLYIKGSMDPLLSTADVTALVKQLKSLGIQRITGHIIADASFKDGDEYGWGWCWDDENPVLSPLLCGGKPGLAASLSQALRKAGIKTGSVTNGTAPSNAREIVALRRPLTEVLQPMMKESDNLCAEAIFYQISARSAQQMSGKHYSRRQSISAINDLISRANGEFPLPSLSGFAITSTVADGSGLSLYNYQTPATFTRLLSYAAIRPDSIYNPLLTALPIAAVDGTLKNRMAETPAAFNVRAKTGTVTAVSTLVGYATQRSTNHLIAFAIMNQGVRRSADGRTFQDKVCALISE